MTETSCMTRQLLKPEGVWRLGCRFMVAIAFRVESLEGKEVREEGESRTRRWERERELVEGER